MSSKCIFSRHDTAEKHDHLRDLAVIKQHMSIPAEELEM